MAEKDVPDDRRGTGGSQESDVYRAFAVKGGVRTGAVGYHRLNIIPAGLLSRIDHTRHVVKPLAHLF